MDRVAKRLADRAKTLVGNLTDIPYADWEGSTDSAKNFWREIAKASQHDETQMPKGKK